MPRRVLRRSLPACVVASFLVARGAAAQAPPDPAVDCAGAFNEAGTSRDAHRLREARTRYLVCAQPACPSFVRLCVGAAQEVGAAIPSVVFVAKDPAGATLVDVAVTMDGQPLAASLSGTSVDVDPGKHVFTFTARGYDPQTREIVVPEGKKDQVETVTLAKSAAAVAPLPPPLAPAPAPDASLGPTPAPPAADAGSRGGSMKLAGLLVAGGGVVAAGIGVAFGLSASSAWSRAKSECVPGACGSGSTAQHDHDAAQTSATLSTILIAAGGAAIVGGGLLWLLAPSRSAEAATPAASTGVPLRKAPPLHLAPWIAASTAGLGLGGSF